MPLEIAQVLRLKGMIDAGLSQELSKSHGLAEAPALTKAYMSVRDLCAQMVSGTEVEPEFTSLFPAIEIIEEGFIPSGAALEVSAIADRARLLLAQLGGWLASWPSADQLVSELIAALEEAEAQADETERARLSSLIDGLKGAGRQIAVSVVTAYLERVHL